jgi:solute carrier family 25 (mitochondrial thiamine pyrophosphate transporter), member 19
VESFVSGACEGATATTATYPLDLLRTRFAAQGPATARIYRSLTSSISEIARTEGVRGFFRGLAASLAQIVPYMGLFFASYESLRLVLHHSLKPSDRPFPLQALLPPGAADVTAGVAASALSKTFVFPLDLARKRLQVQGPTRTRYRIHSSSTVPEYRGGVASTLMEILRREGVRGMYRGLGVGLGKAVPAGAVTMWTYERALGILRA